jgi:hypothetical protein
MLRQKKDLPEIPAKPVMVGISFTPEWYASKKLIEEWEEKYTKPCLVLKRDLLNKKMYEGWSAPTATSSVYVLGLSSVSSLNLDNFEWAYLDEVDFLLKNMTDSSLIDNYTKLQEDYVKLQKTLDLTLVDINRASAILAGYKKS